MKIIEIKGEIIDDITGKFMTDYGIENYAYPAKLNADLTAAQGDNVTVEINSPGGLVDSASEMYTKLKNYSGQVTVNIVGEADSSGSLVAMAGDKIMMAPLAMMMIHRASAGAVGNSDDLASALQRLNESDKNIISIYAEKTGRDEQEIYNLMCKTTWMSAETAVKEGFADEIMQFSSGAMNSTIPVPRINLEIKNKNNQDQVKHKLGLLFGGK